jgi:DNA polymerase-3 subunit epsilon
MRSSDDYSTFSKKKMTQLQFDLDASAPLDQTLSLEDMAQALSAHPDYKVKRRLVPKLDFGPASGAAITRMLILDTETTGLDYKTEKIIELAMLAVDIDLQTGLPVGPVEIYEGFEDPCRPISPEITQLTGITDADVTGQHLNEAKVQDMVARADLIVAHNAAFDRPFVEARLEVFESKPWACSFAGIDWKAQGRGSAKLEFLASECGLFYDAHRAQVDCHAVLQVLLAPLKAVKTSGQFQVAGASQTSTGLLQLIASAQNPRTVLRATGSPFESKDKLKARGYRWDAEGRVWSCNLKSQEALDAECEWLKAQVYGGRAVRLQLEIQDSRVQFSNRPGKASDRIL